MEQLQPQKGIPSFTCYLGKLGFLGKGFEEIQST